MDPVRTSVSTPQTTMRDPALWSSAQALEASFLAEMLKNAGVGTPRETFGGGVGEEPFTSFLTGEYAKSVVAQGGIGLAEGIYRALIDSGDQV